MQESQASDGRGLFPETEDVVNAEEVVEEGGVFVPAAVGAAVF